MTDTTGGNFIPSVMRDEHQGSLIAKRITDVGSDLQLQYDDTTTADVIYVGEGAKGLATSVTGWLITKYDFTTGIIGKTAIGKWDDRETLTYQ